MITFAIKLGNLHPTSLCTEPRLWWMGSLMYHRLLYVSRKATWPSVCVKSR